MTDASQQPGIDSVVDDETQPHRPKHRLEGVPVDAESLLKDFRDDPDTEQAG